jgi:uncharacterized low-complexity protein
MDKRNIKEPLAAALGSAFAVTLAASPVASADANPFGMSELSSGYMQVAEGKCGEGKKAEEGKCGGEKKAEEGKCGGEKKAEEGKCGGEKKTEEGKCGEGKCGGKK